MLEDTDDHKLLAKLAWQEKVLFWEARWVRQEHRRAILECVREKDADP